MAPWARANHPGAIGARLLLTALFSLTTALVPAPEAQGRTLTVADHEGLVALLVRPRLHGVDYRFAPTLVARAELDAEWLRLQNGNLLRRLPFVRTLSLRRATVASFDFLASMPHLERLDLSHTTIRSLAPLSRARSLVELDLSDTAVADLRPLGRLSSLGTLDLCDSRVTDLTPLKERRLARLTLGGTGRWSLPDLSPLAAVTTLTLRRAPRGLDLGPLRRARITELVLDGTALADISALAGHPTLARLSLRHSGVGTAAVRALLGRSPGLQVVMPDGRQVGRVMVWVEAPPDPRDYPCLVGAGPCTVEDFGARRVPAYRFVMP